MSFSFVTKLKPVKGSVFEVVKYRRVDPRERFIANVEAQIILFNGGTSTVKPTFTRDEASKQVKFSVKFGNTGLNLNGTEDTSYVVNESDFVEVFNDIVAAAKTGAFDDKLNKLSAAMADQLSAARIKRAATATA